MELCKSAAYFSYAKLNLLLSDRNENKINHSNFRLCAIFHAKYMNIINMKRFHFDLYKETQIECTIKHPETLIAVNSR